MIKITNTLKTGESELPEPGSKIRMFVCGPTVYDYVHIGNARTFVIFDVIAKYLRHRGYKLNYIQNITDIDDRIINRAKESGVDTKELAEKFEKIFLDNMESLKVSSVDKYVRATDHIPEVIKQVETLIKKGNAYLIKDDGYYFNLKTFPEYGKLSGRTMEMADDAVSRIDESSGKRNKGDFCLWKLAPHRSEASGAGFSKEGEPSWESELGAGRPGWHIEDTAITEKYLGPRYEIHGGGQDLIFPHHEAEIAQQESASGLKPFVRYWLHVGFLVNKGGKMSKSLGNFMTVEEALKEYSPEALRFYFLSARYRAPLDYTEDNLKQAEAAVNRIGEFLTKISSAKNSTAGEDNGKIAKIITVSQEKFNNEMANDFNSPKAIAQIFKLIKKINPLIDEGKLDTKSANKIQDFFDVAEKVLGIVPSKLPELPEKVKQLVSEREEARKSKNYAVADNIRNQIIALGYQIDDTIYGQLLKRRG